MTPAIIVHYHEIALKGGNRDWFERKLIDNIRWAVRDVAGVEVRRMSGRVVVRWTDDARMQPTDSARPPAEGLAKAGITDALQKVFGIASILVGYEVRQEYAGLEEDVVAMVKSQISNFKCSSFAVRVKRGNKQYPMNSMEVERTLGAAINVAMGWKVDLTNPDITVCVEIIERTAFVFMILRHFDRPSPRARGEISPIERDLSTRRLARDDGLGAAGKIPGPGGLPVGVSGRVLCLLSSGFDSPVASWMMMKRGCIVDFVHFHSYPYTSDASKRNVEEIVRVLQPWQQRRGHLYAVPLIEYQKQILTQAPHELRVLLYRRIMFRVADAIAREHRAEALVTGENLGQVASQTIPNMAAVEAAASLPVFRPLLGFDKQEIINRAEAIGTAEISKRPYDDCCSLFTPQHPATHATSAALDAVERDLHAAEWAQKLLALVERVAL